MNLRWALKEPITIRAIELDVRSVPGAVVVVGIIDANTRVRLAIVPPLDVRCAIPATMLRDPGPMTGPLKRTLCPECKGKTAPNRKCAACGMVGPVVEY